MKKSTAKDPVQIFLPPGEYTSEQDADEEEDEDMETSQAVKNAILDWAWEPNQEREQAANQTSTSQSKMVTIPSEDLAAINRNFERSKWYYEFTFN